jgi:methionyl-tRNA formyltransferase
MLSTIFMGTPEIAVPALRLLATRTRVTLVVTQPDRPAGRGHQVMPPPVKQAAAMLGLPVWQPETLRGAEGDPRLATADLFVVMAYGEILRQAVLDLPRACINLHASLLPRWRGASPLQACLRAGDAATGVTVMGMVRALDAGPMYLAERVPLTASTTLPELHDRLADAAATALGRFLDAWPQVSPTPQDEAHVTYCHKLTPEHGHLDWTQSASELERWVRAYTPAPGCWTMIGGERYRILAVAEDSGSAEPGSITVTDGVIHIGCGDGRVRVLRLQAPGGKPLAAADFLRGRSLPGNRAS